MKRFIGGLAATLVAVFGSAAAVTALVPSAVGAQTRYEPRVSVTDTWITGNGRTVRWSASQALAVVQGRGRPGTCRTFTLTVRATEYGRPSIVLNEVSKTLTACYRGRNWRHTGYMDIPPQRSAYVYFRVSGGARQRWTANVRPGTR